MKHFYNGVIVLICFIVESQQQYQSFQQLPQPQTQAYQQYQQYPQNSQNPQNPQYAQTLQAQAAYYPKQTELQSSPLRQPAAYPEEENSIPPPPETLQPEPPLATQNRSEPYSFGQQDQANLSISDQYHPDVANLSMSDQYQPDAANLSMSDQNIYNQSETSPLEEQVPPPAPPPPAGDAPPKNPKKNPLTYSLSFFMFDTKEMIGKLNHENTKSNHSLHTKGNSTTAISSHPTHLNSTNKTISSHPMDHKNTSDSISSHKDANSYQKASVNHPKLSKTSLFPQCHHCNTNSTYEQCVNENTIKTCNKGLKNICFTKSHVKNGSVLYEMGCADHKQCHKAKAVLCQDKKKCFTCCQWDKCNSSPHYGEQITGFMMENGSAQCNTVYLAVVVSLLQLCLIFAL